MTAATTLACHGNLRRVPITKASTTVDANGGVLHRIIVSASASGTLLVADGRGNLYADALALTAGTHIELGIPFEGDLTLTGGGTSFNAVLIIEG